MKWRLVSSAFMAGGMSALVALVVTIINTGFDAGLPLRWLKAWCLAFPVAWAAAIGWGPTALKLAAMITPPPKP
ncbi:MAG: DUF2798 domain-containing protein [Pseudomonadota bacterium]